MCFLCDDDLVHTPLDDIDEQIARHGCALITRSGEGACPGWVYTVGPTDRDHPELMTFEEDAGPGELVLVHLLDRVLAGERFEPAASARCRFEPGLGLTVGFVEVAREQIERGLVDLGSVYYGDVHGRGVSDGALGVLQVVLPDETCRHEHQVSRPRLDTATDVITSFHGPIRAARRAERRRSRGRGHYVGSSS